MTWILENFETILAIYGGLVVISTAIVKWTKTDKDDKVLAKIIKFFDNFSTAFSREDLAKLAEATKKSKK